MISNDFFIKKKIQKGTKLTEFPLTKYTATMTDISQKENEAKKRNINEWMSFK